MLQKATKRRALCFARPRIAVPRQVEKVMRALDQKDIERAGLPGRAGGFGDTSPHQRIEQRRFADVGATEEGDFGERGIELRIGSGE